MFLNVSYGWLAAGIAVSWVLNVLLNVPSKSMSQEEWNARVTKPLVKNGNEMFYMLLALPVAWFLNNFYLMGYSLSVFTWIIRVFLAILALSGAFGMICSVPSLTRIEGRRIFLSNLILAAISAVCALSI